MSDFDNYAIVYHLKFAVECLAGARPIHQRLLFALPHILALPEQHFPPEVAEKFKSLLEKTTSIRIEDMRDDQVEEIAKTIVDLFYILTAMFTETKVRREIEKSLREATKPEGYPISLGILEKEKRILEGHTQRRKRKGK